MKKDIVINAAINEVRVAITEDGRLSEYYIELPEKEKSIGNIYLGKVSKIVTGINAAFIDIGLNQDAFLHFSDIDDTNEKNLFFEDDDTENNLEEKKTQKSKKGTKKKSLIQKVKFHTKKSGAVDINLEPGQLILVQVIREAYHSKGMKVTTKLGIPGRYTVLLPFDNVLGVSKKIASYV
ncbi:MAG TPA: S1 RNA-binding domain-containing protein, partial [Candidatus Kapabacteria bacterium]|nr:S1 RNA-binding domain-containing protein [Candidatus Kapabacteria bacterium]